MSHKIECEFKGNMTFAADVNGHVITMDADETVGGENHGPRPKLLLLAGLAGCTGMDVVSILRKMQQKIETFRLSVEGNLTEEHPKYYKKITIVYQFTGENIDREKVKKAIELSQEKYCGVSEQLKKGAAVTYSIVINGQ